MIVFLCWVQGSGERSPCSKNVLSSETTTGTGIHCAKPGLPGYVFNVLCSIFYLTCSITLRCTITMLLFFPEGRNRGLERLTDLPRVMQLSSGEDGIYVNLANLTPEATLLSGNTSRGKK